jgi:hypothetical protein
VAVRVCICVCVLKRKGAREMNNGIKTIAPNYLLSSAQQRRRTTAAVFVVVNLV